MRWSVAMCAALALMVSPPASAAAAPAEPASLEDVVARWVDAVGGAARLERVRGATLAGERVESGVPGRLEERVGPARWRESLTEGEDRRLTVCRGAAGWVRDWNGHVHALEECDLTAAVDEARLRALLYAGAVRALAASGEASFAGPDPTGRWRVLRLAPAGGAPFDLMLDPASGLPARAVSVSGGDTTTVTLGDWRVVDGVRVPFALGVLGRDAVVADSTRWSRVTFGAPPGDAEVARPADAPPDYRFAAGAAATGIPFDFETDHVLVQASVNGRPPIWFVLDTGAEANIIDSRRLEEFGLKPFGASRTSGGGNSTSYAFTHLDRLTVGGVTLLHQRAGVLDVRGLERIFGVPLGGLLGYDFISRFVMTLDYGTRTMSVAEPRGWRYAGRGARVPIALVEGVPRARAAVSVGGEPIDAEVVIDVGAADNLNLTRPFVMAHQLLERARRRPVGTPNTLPGSEKEFFAQTSVRGRLDSVRVGEVALASVPVNLMLGRGGAYGSSAFSGALGEGILRRFTGTYDYSRGALYLEPNAAFATPFPPRRTFGATFLADGAELDQFQVTGVRKGSPADSVGLQVGDRVTALDGRPATAFRMADLRRALLDDGARHALEVKRGDAPARRLEFTVRTLVLDDL